jgi:hypothetical protein
MESYGSVKANKIRMRFTTFHLYRINDSIWDIIKLICGYWIIYKNDNSYNKTDKIKEYLWFEYGILIFEVYFYDLYRGDKNCDNIKQKFQK